MATQYQQHLVNKQFNSPIKLYSDANVRETLAKQTQILANGAVGIDFHNSNLSKPGNLANSAVLRMLEEEEERQRQGQSPRAKRVTWPPPPEDNNQGGVVHQVPIQTQDQPQQQLNHHQQPQAPIQQHQQPQQQHQPGPLSPLYINSNQQPQPQYIKPSAQVLSPTQQQPSPRWAPVQSPVSPKVQPVQFQPNFQSHQQQQQPLSPPQNNYQSPQGYRPVPAPVAPPPSLITLRSQAPVSQAPAPVYTSQPATQSLRGGNNMRGDQKWPPENVKQQTAAENQARVQLAKGPACRPRRVNKDYSGFFAQHALNSTYPGYRAPPGTQYYSSQQPGVSNF